MKRYFLIAVIFITGLSLSYSQVETHYYENGEASKHINKPIRSIETIIEMPSFDLAQLEKEDAERDRNGGMFRFGKPFDVFYTLADGQWDSVDGGRIWSMTFKSEGALSLNFIFNDFRLQEGAELYVVNKDESVLFGPVSKESTTENGVFLTDIIKGDQASIYLFEPTDCEGTSSLTIKRVVHGYRGFESSIDNNRSLPVYTQDVACYPNYTMESDAVAMMLHSNGTCVGTGFLIMSADCSFKPYLMTSSLNVDVNDDEEFSVDEISEAENSMFKFRYKYTTCGGGNYANSYTYNQANFRAGWFVTRFALLELKSNLKSNLSLTWLGWNILNQDPSSGACIHHPENDVMKISTFDHSLYYNTSSNYMWNVQFDEGIGYIKTKGAPLLDQNKRVAGHVYYATCYEFPYYIKYYTMVGKLSESWYGGWTNTTQLCHWLDPDDTGQFYMNSRRSIGNLEIIGDSAISMNGSSYYVSNLPPGLTVTWSITDSYYQGVLEEDEPITNQCTIYGDASHEILNATLKASVYSGTTLVQSASKTVSTEEVFHGTYYNGQTTKPINLPNPLYVLPGTQVYISSTNLVGASVYYTGNVTPYIWSFDSTNGLLYVGMPSSPSGAATISVHVTTALGNSFTLPIVRASQVYSMSVGVNHGYITVSLFEGENSEDQTLRDSDSDGALSSKQVSWTLEVINATTGKKVFDQKIESSDFTIDTIGWEPGVYIVKATIGDEELTEKVIVK